MKIRCISLRQPWASLMACGAKFLETRDWGTRVRGPVYIHAAQTHAGFKELRCCHPRIREAMEAALGKPFLQGPFNGLPLGALIARGEIISSAPAMTALRDHPSQEPFGNFAPGRFAHLYQNLTPIEPIPFRGKQGFFFAEIPADSIITTPS